MPAALAAICALLFSGCSFVYARLTYDFMALPENPQVLYEPGAEDLAQRAAAALPAALAAVEERQFAPFKDRRAIRVYAFNDRKRYASFTHASVLSRASSTTDEVYLSERLREKPDTLPSILTHELSHVHLRQYAGTFRYLSDLPGWFLEGLAVSVSSGGGAETVSAAQAQAHMRTAARFEPDESGSILGHKTAHDYGLEPHMYYRQASLFVEYLRDTSPPAFAATLRDILAGERFGEAWRKRYGRTLAELWRGFEAGPEPAGAMPAYVPRFGRTRPVVAVVGENSFTELTDYVIPYGVLSEAGVADVHALATRAGPMQMLPALKLMPQASVAEFDERFPDGADYVFVPAVHRSEDPVLLGWLSQQARKGATIIGVCDGVWVLANAGLLKGRRAVGHWYSFEDLGKRFSETTWVRDRRYLADGNVVTTTGVSASLPVSVALVAAIGGRERAVALAQTLGVRDWSAAHRSDDFKLSVRHISTVAWNWLAFWSHEDLGIPVSAGVDEIALALTADAYSRTYRSQALAVSSSANAVRTRRGLSILPDRVAGGTDPPDRMLPAPERTTPAAALDAALDGIARDYGRDTAALVALALEYPGY
jgi:transcriptional regulator GlxA family with amidase domain